MKSNVDQSIPGVGDWMINENGIGKILSLHECFVEEFREKYHGNRLAGAYERIIAIYKIFCGFDGVARKRFLCDYIDLKYCSKLSEEQRLILDRSCKEHRDELERFESFRSKKVFGEWSNIWIGVKKGKSAELLDVVTLVNDSIPKPFTYKEYERKLEENHVHMLAEVDAKAKKFISVSLFNNGFRYRNKQRLFSKANAIIQTKAL